MRIKFLFCFLCFLFITRLKAEIPTEAYTFGVNLSFTYFDKLNSEKLEEASLLIKQTIQTPEFKDAIIHHRFNGKRKFHYNRGFSNRTIYKIILEGAEELNNFKNNQLDAEIDFFYDLESNVVGYTMKSTPKIWINQKYFYKYTAGQLAGHLMHEWLHKLGFSHESEKNPDRKYSVPYAVGKIVKEISHKLTYSQEFYGPWIAP